MDKIKKKFKTKYIAIKNLRLNLIWLTNNIIFLIFS